MQMILICVLVVIALPVGLAVGWVLEKAHKYEAERELGFWDSNVLAALNGSAIT